MDGLLPENVRVLIYWLAQVEFVREGRKGDHNIQFQKNLSSGRSARSYSYSSCWREIISTTGFSAAFNGFSTKASIFDLILISASSFALRDKQYILFGVFNVARIFFLWCHYRIRRWQRNSIFRISFLVLSEIPFQNIDVLFWWLRGLKNYKLDYAISSWLRKYLKIVERSTLPGFIQILWKYPRSMDIIHISQKYPRFVDTVL